jgi:preprotein translocase subunit SecB
MAKDTKSSAKDAAQTTPKNGHNGAEKQPIFNLVGHYLKDLSFECPHAPFGNMPKMNFDLQVAVDIHNLQDNMREVVVQLTGKALDENGENMYVAEIASAGVFHVENLEPEQFLPLLAVEGASMVYPFARQKLLSCVIDGGYPAPLLGPIDFRRLFEEGKKQAEAQKAS